MRVFDEFDAEKPFLVGAISDINTRLMQQCTDANAGCEELSTELHKLIDDCVEHLRAVVVPLGVMAPDERQKLVATLVFQLEVELNRVESILEIDLAKTLDRVMHNSIKPLVLTMSQQNRTAMTPATLELIKLLGSINGRFEPKHLALVLFFHPLPSANPDSTIGKLVDAGKSVSERASSSILRSSESPTIRQRTAIIEAVGEDELSATFESVPFLMWAQVSQP